MTRTFPNLWYDKEKAKGVSRLTGVLFVCLGNICRSPMAEAIFRDLLQKRGLSEQFRVDSAGLGGWHVGEEPHDGTRRVLRREGIAHEGLRARQFRSEDFDSFDYIVVMDEQNLQDITRLEKYASQKVFRLMDFAPDRGSQDVPDPFFDGRFDEVYEMIRAGCEGLLSAILQAQAKR